MSYGYGEIIYQPCEDANTLEGLRNCGCDPLMDGITLDDLTGKVVKSTNQTTCYNDNPDDHALRRHLLEKNSDPITRESATVLSILGQSPNELMREKHDKIINKLLSYDPEDYFEDTDYLADRYKNGWCAKETVEHLKLLLNTNNKELLTSLMNFHEIDMTKTLLENVVGKDWRTREEDMSTFKKIQNFLREWWGDSVQNFEPNSFMSTFTVEYLLGSENFEDFKVFFTEDTL